MIVEYELDVTCLCPVDSLPDNYRMTVAARRSIPVETIIAAAQAESQKKMYQEDLCQQLHRTINAQVTLTGWHSGVRTVVTCGDLS